MQMPQVGDLVEVVVAYEEPYVPTGRRATTLKLVGITIETPPWMRQHAALSLLNMANEARCHIPAHRIISIGGVNFDNKPETADRRFEVTSSKTGEKYQVTQNGRTKKWSCTCVGYQFHSKCRHVARFIEQEG